MSSTGVRDATGREQIVLQPIYSSIKLLKEGLTDFSYEAGWLRSNFGLSSNE